MPYYLPLLPAIASVLKWAIHLSPICHTPCTCWLPVIILVALCKLRVEGTRIEIRWAGEGCGGGATVPRTVASNASEALQKQKGCKQHAAPGRGLFNRKCACVGSQPLHHAVSTMYKQLNYYMYASSDTHCFRVNNLIVAPSHHWLSTSSSMVAGAR
jgi:hypothetical protein